MDAKAGAGQIPPLEVERGVAEEPRPATAVSNGAFDTGTAGASEGPVPFPAVVAPPAPPQSQESAGFAHSPLPNGPPAAPITVFSEPPASAPETAPASFSAIPAAPDAELVPPAPPALQPDGAPAELPAPEPPAPSPGSFSSMEAPSVPAAPAPAAPMPARAEEPLPGYVVTEPAPEEEPADGGPNWMLAFVCSWAGAFSLYQGWELTHRKDLQGLNGQFGIGGYLILGIGLVAFALEALFWGKSRRRQAAQVLLIVIPLLLVLAGVAALFLFKDPDPSKSRI